MVEAEQAEVARRRGLEPRRLASVLRGDLDWIVLKALEKERDRRYPTAASFREDIERFLNHEPVRASPPSAGYLVRKFVRRHRGPVVVAGAFLLLLVAAAWVSTSLAVWAKRAERRATSEARVATAERNRAEDNERAARREAERSRRVVEQVRTMFFDPSRSDVADPAYTLRELLTEATEEDRIDYNEAYNCDADQCVLHVCFLLVGSSVGIRIT